MIVREPLTIAILLLLGALMLFTVLTAEPEKPMPTQTQDAPP